MKSVANESSWVLQKKEEVSDEVKQKQSQAYRKTLSFFKSCGNIADFLNFLENILTENVDKNILREQ